MSSTVMETSAHGSCCLGSREEATTWARQIRTRMNSSHPWGVTGFPLLRWPHKQHNSRERQERRSLQIRRRLFRMRTTTYRMHLKHSRQRASSRAPGVAAHTSLGEAPYRMCYRCYPRRLTDEQWQRLRALFPCTSLRLALTGGAYNIWALRVCPFGNPH